MNTVNFKVDVFCFRDCVTMPILNQIGKNLKTLNMATWANAWNFD